MSLLDDPEFRKRIEKYDKIINEDKLKRYNKYYETIKFCDKYKPKNNIERLIKGLYIQNEIIIEKLG